MNICHILFTSRRSILGRP